ncbi:predicted protein [Histoplasma capsulatum G186AR]|uniref:Uncharacterized protein n=1 Tax=Ajellomyces capsulatus (strain G186AR / H82 / ATCC MYA-2454 / RMSCC 2432) TaxID=447093 RepID=C0NC69_AJECG|nr:uncharacterized protein HCBG_00715 [Histoplasma capsulatum G186AR]EEH11260.1 predicted protein [Histoplasma capsulatum G186AR]
MTRKRSTCNNNGYSVTKLKYKFAEFVLKEAYWGTVKEPVLLAMFTSVRVARNIRKHSGGHVGKDFRLVHRKPIFSSAGTGDGEVVETSTALFNSRKGIG